MMFLSICLYLSISSLSFNVRILTALIKIETWARTKIDTDIFIPTSFSYQLATHMNEHKACWEVVGHPKCIIKLWLTAWRKENPVDIVRCASQSSLFTVLQRDGFYHAFILATKTHCVSLDVKVMFLHRCGCRCYREIILKGILCPKKKFRLLLLLQTCINTLLWGTQNCYFERMFRLLFSIEWKWMVVFSYSKNMRASKLNEQ